jgi:hypothetical protein
MSEVKVINRKAFCKECGQNVDVKEKPGEQGRIAELRHVLVDNRGHVVAERSTDTEPWHEAA